MSSAGNPALSGSTTKKTQEKITFLDLSITFRNLGLLKQLLGLTEDPLRLLLLHLVHFGSLG